MLASVLVASVSAVSPSDEGVPLDIDVRSSVDQRWVGFRKLGAIAHGKLYLLASARDVSLEPGLIKPVDEAALAKHLRQELSRQGFREITAQEIPEIVLTVTYGRGFLRNPYLAGALLDENSGTPTMTLTLPTQALKHREVHFERRMQKAQFEKLYVIITAWQYPGESKEKPYMYWRTVMLTDNPDGRNLNLAIPAMLAAGSKWFDRHIRDEEVNVQSTMPGSVNLGPLNVIELGVPGK